MIIRMLICMEILQNCMLMPCNKRKGLPAAYSAKITGGNYSCQSNLPRNCNSFCIHVMTFILLSTLKKNAACCPHVFQNSQVNVFA